MKQLTCEMCGGTDLIKQDGALVCQNCGMKYSMEEARKMLIEGTVDVQGTVKVDNSELIKKSLTNARRALGNEDWEEVENYYNMVEQYEPNNIEAVFFSSFAKAMIPLTEVEYNKVDQRVKVLKKSMSIINDCYDATDEKKEALQNVASYIKKMFDKSFVRELANPKISAGKPGSISWCEKIITSIRDTFVAELRQIVKNNNEPFVQQLIKEMLALRFGGCYVATCVYGSYDCPEVWTLRRYRDNTLGATRRGRAFIKLYYAISPTLVKWFGETKWFKKMWKGKLDRMVKKLQDKGVESTPYQDKNW